MHSKPIELAEANALIQHLVGLPVSRPWSGFGSAICFELGKLALRGRSTDKYYGEASIFVEWDWRVESGSKVQFGSSNSRPKIKRGVEGLHGVLVEAILISGDIPELSVRFSNGSRLMTAVMVAGDPAWNVVLPDTTRVYCENGVVCIGDGGEFEISIEEKNAIAHTEATAQRWGKPTSEPYVGRCADCRWFVRLDGDFSLLDYGACTSSDSGFDGRVVNVNSGCGSFEQE